jgi:phosphatidylinositol 4-kinase
MSGGFFENGEIKPSKSDSARRHYYTAPFDLSTHYFTAFGSSINQFPNIRSTDSDYEPKVQFPINYLQTIFALAKKLLTKETLEHLDEQANDMFALNQIKSYGYISFSETINLVMVTLLRELLQNQKSKHNWQPTYSILKLIHCLFQIYPHHLPKMSRNLSRGSS